MSTTNRSNTNISLPIDVLDFVSSDGWTQLDRIQASINKTSVKSWVAQAQSKLSKLVSASGVCHNTPIKMPQVAIENTKEHLDTHCQSVVLGGKLDDVNVIEPCAKQHTLTVVEYSIFTPEEWRHMICNGVCLLWPHGDNLVYLTTGAATIITTLVHQNATSNSSYSERTLLILIKENMIKEKRVPVLRR